MLLRLIILALVLCQPPHLVWARSRSSNADSEKFDLSTSLANDGVSSISLWALESTFELGSLYDKKSGQLLNTSIFLDDRDGLHRNIRLKKALDIPVVGEGIVKKPSNLFEVFRIGTDRSMAVQLGKVDLDENNIFTPVIKSVIDLDLDPRTGEFRNPSRTFRNTATHKYWYEYLQTSEEYLDLKNDDAKYLIDFEKLRENQEAHVIVGITKGAKLIMRSKTERQSRRKTLAPGSKIYSDVPLNITRAERQEDSDQGRQLSNRPTLFNKPTSSEDPIDSDEDRPIDGSDEDDPLDGSDEEDEKRPKDEPVQNDPDDSSDEFSVRDPIPIDDDDDDDDLRNENVSKEPRKRFLIRGRRQAPRRRSPRRSYQEYNINLGSWNVDELKKTFREVVKESDPSKTIQYTLISIRDLLKYFPENNQLPEFDDPTSFSSKSIDPKSYEEARDILDGINSVGRHLGLFLGRMKSYKKYLNHDDIGKGEVLQRSFLKTKQLFEQGLRQAVDAYREDREEEKDRPTKSRSRSRSGSRSRPRSRSESRRNRLRSNSRRLKRQAEPNEFETLFDVYYDSPYSFENVNKTLNEDFGHVREKIKLLAKTDIHRNKQVKYLGKDKSFKNIPLIPSNGAKSNPGYDQSRNEIYLLYFKEDLSKVPDNLKWRQTRKAFFNLLQKREPTNFDRQFFLVDCDFAYHFELCEVLQEPVIHQYLGGELVSTDYPHSDTVDVPALPGPSTTTTEDPIKEKIPDRGDTLNPLVVPPSIRIFDTRPTLKPEEPESDCKIISRGITLRERAQIVDEHNKYRSFVASGFERRGNPGPQPQASSMKRLTWDDELARAAQDAAEQCISEVGRRFKRLTLAPASLGNVGQNVNTSTNPWVTRSELPLDPNWKDAIVGWYDEVQDFDSRDVDSFRDPNNQQGDTSHYTQLVWAKTSKIGCGYAQYIPRNREFSGVRVVYVCNYGPAGNVLGQPVYRRPEDITPIEITPVEIPDRGYIPARKDTPKTVFDPQTGTWGVLQPERDPRTDTSVHPFWLTVGQFEKRLEDEERPESENRRSRPSTRFSLGALELPLRDHDFD